MFDISFAELLVIAVVALLVIGPEKLPKVARTLGAFAGRMQRYVAQVKEEVNREARFEELQKLQQEIGNAAQNTKASILETVSKIAPTQELADELEAEPKISPSILPTSGNAGDDTKFGAKPDLASMIKNQHLKTVKSRKETP